MGKENINNKTSHAELDSASSTHSVSQQQAWKILKINQTPYYNLTGRGQAVKAAVWNDALLNRGFTLLEILIAVIIIAVLAAIAVPAYQKAVMKSRFTALMPIGKTLAGSNEVYYLEHGTYASRLGDLPVAGKNYDTAGGPSAALVSDESYGCTIVYNDTKLPDNNYIAFQKHSPKFADTTMCEARGTAEDYPLAHGLCTTLGGTDLGGGGVTDGFTAYLLSGNAMGSTFCPTGATCNSAGEITECPDGKTLKEGKCVTCDIAHAAACSTTSYAAKSCTSGYCMKNGACTTCNYSGTSQCVPYDNWNVSCNQKTFGDNAICASRGYLNALCYGASFNGNSTCKSSGRCGSSATYGITTFTDNASCTDRAFCNGAVFSGKSSCNDGLCHITNDGGVFSTQFTDESSCTGASQCYGAVFSGNSTCTSTTPVSSSAAGCSGSGTYGGLPMVSTFKDNAVCAGTGCNTAIYENNACCAGTSCPSGVRKCIYNSTTQTYERVGYWN